MGPPHGVDPDRANPWSHDDLRTWWEPLAGNAPADNGPVRTQSPVKGPFSYAEWRRLQATQQTPSGPLTHPTPDLPSSLQEPTIYDAARARFARPNTPPGDDEIQHASSWAILLALGVVRLWSWFNRASSQYEITMQFPNLSELSFKLNTDATDHLSVPTNGRGEPTTTTLKHPNDEVETNPPRSGRPEAIKIEKITNDKGEEYPSRIRLVFENGDTLVMDLEVSKVSGGDASGNKLRLRPHQPEPYTGDTQRFHKGKLPPDPKALAKMRHSELVSENSIRGRLQWYRQVNIITLANGDRVRLQIDKNHNGRGAWEVRSAELDRLRGNEEETWIGLKIVTRRGTGGEDKQIRLTGEGYKLNIGIDMPLGSHGGIITINEVSADEVPELKLPFDTAPARAPAKTGWLIPTKETARKLHNPPWHGDRIQLTFTGEIDGRNISDKEPIVIAGHFERGRFVPEIDMFTRPEGVFAAGTEEVLEFKPTRLPRDGWGLRIQLSDSTTIDLPLQTQDNLFGFATSAETIGTRFVDNVYDNVPIRGDSPAHTRIAWQPAPANTVSEVARFISHKFFHRNAAASTFTGTQDGETLIKVVLTDGATLIMRRSEFHERILYEPMNLNGQLSIITLGTGGVRSLEGLVWKNGGDASTVVTVLKPWLGLAREQPEARAFFDLGLQDIRLLFDQARNPPLRFSIPKVFDPQHVEGMLGDVTANGHERLLFELADGRILDVRLTGEMTTNDGLLALSSTSDGLLTLSSTSIYGDLELTVIVREPNGEEHTAQLVVEDGEWILKGSGDKHYIFKLDGQRLVDGEQIAITLTEREVKKPPELITPPRPPLPPARPAEERPPTLPRTPEPPRPEARAPEPATPEPTVPEPVTPEPIATEPATPERSEPRKPVPPEIPEPRVAEQPVAKPEVVRPTEAPAPIVPAPPTTPAPRSPSEPPARPSWRPVQPTATSGVVVRRRSSSPPPASASTGEPAPTGRGEPAVTPPEPTPTPPAPSPRPVPTRSFPWEEGAFVLPDHSTRVVMRNGILSEGHPRRPAEGQRSRFNLVGGLVTEEKGDNPESSLRVIEDRMRAMEQARRSGRPIDHGMTRSFFAWSMRVDMVYRNGAWIPDTRGQLIVVRRFPTQDHHNRLDWFEMPDKSGSYPIRPVMRDGAWGIQVGEQDHEVIRPYWVVMNEPGKPVYVSPDFGFVQGTPTARAEHQLRQVEIHTNAAKHHLGATPPPAMVVKAQTSSGITARIKPEFGAADYRSPVTIGGNSGLVEFSPGYDARLPDSRFTQFRVYDGNGFNFRMVFQHRGQGNQVQVVGMEAFNREVTEATVSTTASGEYIVSGTLTRPAVLPNQPPTLMPFEMTYRIRDGRFEISSARFGSDVMAMEGLHFNFSTWSKEQIFAERSATNLEIKLTRLEGRKGGGRPPGPPPDVVRKETIVLVPEKARELAIGEREDGATLPETVHAKYRFSHGGTTIDYQIPMQFSERFGIYMPVESNGLVLIRINDELTPVAIERTVSGRHWRLHFGGDMYAFLGNHHTNLANVRGRPVPIFYFSHRQDPSTEVVSKQLIERSLLDPPVRLSINPQARPHFDIRLTIAGKNYLVGMRAVKKGPNKFLYIPTGAAYSMDGEHRVGPVAVHYYMPYRGSPAFVIIDGHGFEIKEHGTGVGLQLELLRQNPGAAGCHFSGRANTHVILEPNDRSALLFVDVIEESFLEQARDATRRPEGSRVIKRLLMDGISGVPFELAFEAQRDSYGHTQVEFRGMAQLTNSGPIMVPCQVMEDGNRVYTRTNEGHYFSFSKFPSDNLILRSHGRSLDQTLIRHRWRAVEPSTSIFSSTIPQIPGIDLRDSFWSFRHNREHVRNTVAQEHGLVPEIIWDMERIFPRGAIVGQTSFEPHPTSSDITIRTFGRPTQNSIIQIRSDFRVGAHAPQNATVTYRGEEIPSELVQSQGRPFLILGGPFKGVTFYYVALPGIAKGSYREVTHPGLREALERDMGHEPLPRPSRLKANDDGTDYYAPLESTENDRALARQLGRSRLWRLEQNQVLPADTTAQDRLTGLLMPDPNRYGPSTRPKLLQRLEAMAAVETLRANLQTCLSKWAQGIVNDHEIETLATKWEDYASIPASNSQKGYKLREFVGELTRLAKKGPPPPPTGGGSGGPGGTPPSRGPDKPTDPKPTAPADPTPSGRPGSTSAGDPGPKAHYTVATAPLGRETLKRLITEIYPAEVAEWINTGIDHLGAENLQQLEEALKCEIGDRSTTVLVKAASFAVDGITQVERIAILLEQLSIHVLGEATIDVTEMTGRMQLLDQAVRTTLAPYEITDTPAEKPDPTRTLVLVELMVELATAPKSPATPQTAQVIPFPTTREALFKELKIDSKVIEMNRSNLARLLITQMNLVDPARYAPVIEEPTRLNAILTGLGTSPYDREAVLLDFIVQQGARGTEKLGAADFMLRRIQRAGQEALRVQRMEEAVRRIEREHRDAEETQRRRAIDRR